jgi:uncharacterized membrane protein
MIFPSWILFAITAYLLLAVVSIGDKFLLDKIKLHYKEYAFYSSAFSSVLLVCLPFVKRTLSLQEILFAGISGFLFVLGVMFYFKAIESHDASQVVPTVSAMMPISTFVIGYYLSGILPEIFSGFNTAPKEIVAFIFLVLGSFFININEGKINYKSLLPAIFASICFAISLLMANVVYSRGSFIEGFLWIKLGWLLFVAILLLDKSLRDNIFGKKLNQKIDSKKVGLVLITQTGGGLAGLLQNYSISLANLGQVAIINSMQGVQYVFLLFFSVILSKFFPNIIREDISKKAISKKAISIIIIAIGLAILSYNPK